MPRNKKYWKRRSGNYIKTDRAPYWHHFDLRPIDDLDDGGLAYALTNVKGIDMLDLNGTEISNESIKLLASLEFIKELRLKEASELNDGCAEDMNRINGLEFLHVKGTGITIDGLLKLHSLTGLKKVLFSADDVDVIENAGT